MAENEGVIRQQLGFDASQAIDELTKLNSALTSLGTQLGGVGSQLGAFNASANQTIASLKQMSSAAGTTLASMTKLASTPSVNLDAALGVGKVTESMKEMQDAARLGTSTYGSAMSAMADQTRTVGTAVSDASQKTHEWVVSWNTLSRVVMTQFIVRALSEIRDAFKEAYESGLQFTKQISEIHAIDPSRSFAQIADDVRKMSDAFNQPLSDVAEAQYQVLSNQFTQAADRANILTAANALSKVTAQSLSDAVLLLTGALNAYGESSDQAGLRAAQFDKTIELGRLRMADLGTALGRVQSIAHESGISMEELQASLVALTIGGVKSTEAATQLRGIISALLKPSTDLQKALNQIGAESGPAAIATYGLEGTLKKLWETTNGTENAFAKLFPNVRALAGASRLAQEGAEKAEKALKDINAVDLSTIQKKLKDFTDTDAEKLTKELNKLSNFFTAEFGLKLIGTLNSLIQLIGGGDGLVGVFRLLTSTLPADIAIIGGIAGAFLFTQKAAALAKTTYVDAFGAIITKAPEAAKALSGLQLAFAALAGVELARMAGNWIGDYINQQIEAPQKAIRDALDAEIKMRDAQTEATIRIEQRKATDTIKILRQHFADANSLYLKDVANYQAAMKVEVQSVKDAFDKIMQMRNKLTQELAAAADAAAKKAIANDMQVAENKEKIQDRTFNTDLQTRNLSPEWQMRMEEERMRQIADLAAKLQASAKDADEQKVADQEWRRAEAYGQMVEQAAKQSGSMFLQRQAAKDLNDLTEKQNQALNKQSAMEKQLSEQLLERGRQAQKNNAELEKERDAIEAKLNQFQKNDKGELTQKSSDQWKKDLAESYQMIQDFIQKVQSTTKGDFLKNFMGDANAFKQMQRDAQNLLGSIYLKELNAAPEAMAKLRDQLQASLDKAGLSAPVIAKIEKFTGKEVVTDGLNAVLDAFQKRWNDIIAQGAKRAGEIADQAAARNAYNSARNTLGNEPMTGATAGGGFTQARADAINAAQKALRDVVAEMDRLSKSSEITDADMAKLGRDMSAIDIGTALPGLANLLERGRISQEIETMSKALKELKDSQAKTPAAVPESEKQEAEAIRQQIEATKQKTTATGESAAQMEREKNAAEGGKTAIDGQFNSVSGGLAAVGDLEQAWWGVEAAAAAAAQAAAAASLAGGGGGGDGGGFDFSEGETALVALGGLIRRFGVGGFVPRGTDTVPAMLSPGEFVMNSSATRRWYSHLVAMNAGSSPAYRSQGGNVSNITVGDINVNGAAQPRETAREVLKSIKRELRRGTSVL